MLIVVIAGIVYNDGNSLVLVLGEHRLRTKEVTMSLITRVRSHSSALVTASTVAGKPALRPFYNKIS